MKEKQENMLILRDFLKNQVLVVFKIDKSFDKELSKIDQKAIRNKTA